MLGQMSRGDKLAGGGAIMLLLALFLPWFGISLGSSALDKALEAMGGGSLTSINAFKAFKVLDIVLLLVAVAVIAVLFLMANGNLDDSLRSSLETVGGIATVAIVWNLFDIGKLSAINVKYGGFLAVIAGFAIAAGGYLNRKDGVV